MAQDQPTALLTGLLLLGGIALLGLIVLGGIRVVTEPARAAPYLPYSYDLARTPEGYLSGVAVRPLLAQPSYARDAPMARAALPRGTLEVLS